MVEACYFCRRTQADLDHLNEEVRTKAYLSYFSNVRAQLDDRQRRITFLQRLRDEEGSDPHFRIGAEQVFADPPAYEKLMPWIDTLIEIARSQGPDAAPRGTIGELVQALLARERLLAAQTEEALAEIRGGFTAGGRSPFALHPTVLHLPVDWTVEAASFRWKATGPSDIEPLERKEGAARPTVTFTVQVCTVCERLGTPR